MIPPDDAMREFQATAHRDLLRLVKSRRLLSEIEAEAAVYALVEIAESIEKVYCRLIPDILSHSDAPGDALKEKLWDVREEFRHIDYHIHDGRLTEL